MSEIAGTAPERSRFWTWLGRGAEAAAPELKRVAFPDLVRTHHAWSSTPHDATSAEAYVEALEHFERREGRLEGAYWCSKVAAGIAVTRQGRRRHFHRATAWAAQPDHLVGALLNECDELGVRVSEVLRGTGQRIAMGLVLCTAGNLLALAEEGSTSAEAAAREAANLEQAQAYYRRAARRQAQLVYVGGMLLGVVVLMGIVLAILAVLHATTDIRWIPHDTAAGTVTSEVSLSTLLPVRDLRGARRERQRRLAHRREQLRGRLRARARDDRGARDAAADARRDLRDRALRGARERAARPLQGADRGRDQAAVLLPRRRVPRRLQRALGEGRPDRARDPGAKAPSPPPGRTT